MFNRYILILFWLGLMALLAGHYYRLEYNPLTGKLKWRNTPVFAAIVILPVLWMATTRGWFADTGAYVNMYRHLPDSFGGIAAYMETVTKDKGFYFTSAVLRVILGSDHVPYLFVIALLQTAAIYMLYRKYSTDYVLSIFLFVASTDYISWMFNGMRQFTAVSILMLATPLMLRKEGESSAGKLIALVIITLLAAAMHQTALLMLPILLIAQGKAWNLRSFLVMMVALVIMVYAEEFTHFLENALSGTQYENVVEDFTEWNDDGTNPIRVAVYSIPAVIAFFGREKIRAEGGVLMNFCANMSVISMGIYLVSMATSGIFVGRLPIYCSLYGYILLPWEADHLFEGRQRAAFKIAMIVGYLGFYFYGMHFQNGLI